MTPAPAEPAGPFKAVGGGKVWSVVANGKRVYIVSGSDARDLTETLASAMNGAWNQLGVPDLIKACKELLPYVEDQVERGQVEGEDTSHYGDARAVRLAHAALAKAGAL